MERNKALLLHSQDGDWEGLFINGRLIREGHHLGEGRSEMFWLDVGAKYQIVGDDLVVKELDDADDVVLGECGGFPKELTQLIGKY